MLDISCIGNACQIIELHNRVQVKYRNYMLHKITKPNIMPALAKINIISMCNAVIMENPSAMTTVACECKSTMQR